MASDLIGRRQMMQQRLDRVRDLELAIREQVELIASRAGMTVEQFDFDGSFRASLASLAGLAARRTTFDIVLTLPGAPLGVRIQQLHGEVKVEVVELDVPYGGAQLPAQLPEPAAQPVSPPVPQPMVSQPMAEGRQVIRGSLVPQAMGPVTEPIDLIPSKITDAMPGASSEDLVVSDLAALLWEGMGEPTP
ncbi:hypothetical protein [Kineosporia sp. NBRC 101731]|uniref:hypothetical protein n=1 Tax=Kineosporia sp. NBRC 101731 TaxID=3032199 RepID=UPI0024A04328|nr:hypothetical protein [Kineosporia sp. NBRC 101731]GLY27476.1 hypothetical protein Kisp02_08410 [Kineosporia sp. NBRC 101731]